ncbi:MAG: hypothetical protein LBL67_01975 [Coriobacteriales bacterium]|nr:hypothetical protein [Coriobacteriales bacterium]
MEKVRSNGRRLLAVLVSVAMALTLVGLGGLTSGKKAYAYGAAPSISIKASTSHIYSVGGSVKVSYSIANYNATDYDADYLEGSYLELGILSGSTYYEANTSKGWQDEMSISSANGSVQIVYPYYAIKPGTYTLTLNLYCTDDINYTSGYVRSNPITVKVSKAPTSISVAKSTSVKKSGKYYRLKKKITIKYGSGLLESNDGHVYAYYKKGSKWKKFDSASCYTSSSNKYKETYTLYFYNATSKKKNYSFKIKVSGNSYITGKTKTFKMK